VVGRYLRAKRVAAGLSLRRVAEQIGVSHVYLGEVERGVRPPLKRERWPQVAEAIPKVTVDELQELHLSDRRTLDLQDAPAKYRALAHALARRMERQDLDQNVMDELLALLRGTEK